MAGCDELLRRRFIAIATDRFDADGTYPQLDVVSEVTALQRWLCDPELGERRFERHFERLAACPSYGDVKADLVENSGFGDGDAVVLYVTGHGAMAGNRHRIVLEHSNPSKLGSTALATGDLVVWIAEQQGLDHVLLVIDLCQAGDLETELVRDIKPLIPDQWIVLLSTSAGADAKVGALTGVVESVIQDIRAGTDQYATKLEPYLDSNIFIGRVRKLLQRQHRQTLNVVQDPYGASCCLPNPRYDLGGGDRVKTEAARSDLAVLEEDMAAHWLRRAPVAVEAGRPWVFTGRARLMERLIAAATGPPGAVVVTGRAGSGKSAVLARLVTCSDPLFRAEHRDLLARVPPIPPHAAVDVAVLATGKGPEQIAAQIGSALGAQPLTYSSRTMLESWLEGIENVLYRRDDPLTLVLDALDESSDPVGVVRSVLQRLNPPEARRMRLVVGVRSVPGEGSGRSRDLAGLATEALDAEDLAVDGEAYWEPEDLRTLVAQALAAPPSPYAGRPAETTQAATAIESGVERSYLLAVLVAAELAARDQPVADTELHELLAGGVVEVVRQELDASFADGAERARVVVLLRATALGFGRGIPWREVWPAVASAIAPGSAAIGDADVERLLRHRIAGYLVRDLEDGVTVYRPFHDALRASLARHVDRFAVGHPDLSEAHGLIARALLALFDPQPQQPPPAYARRHLAEHAAAAGELDGPYLTAQTLPFLDAYALSRVLRLTEFDPNSALGLLLGAWRNVRHRWTWARPDANAAALDVALAAAGAVPSGRPQHDGLSWTPLWAEWASGGTAVGRVVGHGQAPVIAFGTVAGRACLVTSNGWTGAQIWDAATSEPLGPELAVEAPKSIALARGAAGEIVVAVGNNGVEAWDADTGRKRWRTTGVLGHDPAVGHHVAAADIDDHAIVAAATGNNVQLLDVETGLPLAPMFRGDGHVAGLVLATDPGGRTRLVVGRSTGQVEQWYVDGAQMSPAATTVSVGPILTGVAAITFRGRFLFATTDRTPVALLWDADRGVPVGTTERRHVGKVHGVALVEATGALVMATGGVDGQAIVWDAFGGTPASEPLPHSASVDDVAFGTVDGRLMLATACADGNTRLWDPIKPSAARVAASGRVRQTAFAETLDGLLLAGSNLHNQISVRRAVDGEPLGQLGTADAVDIAYGLNLARAPYYAMDLALGELGGEAVAAVATSERAHAWYVRSGQLIAELALADASYFGPVAITVLHSAVLLAHRVDGDIEVRGLIETVPRFRLPTRASDKPWNLRLRFLHHAELGTVLAVMDEEGVELVDAETGERRWRRIETGQASFGALGRLGGHDIFAFCWDDGVGLWSLTEGAPYGPGVHHAGQKSGLALATVGGRDLVLTGHFATVRAWHPRTGRLLSELPFGTSISSIAVAPAGNGHALLAVSGPGAVVVELHSA